MNSPRDHLFILGAGRPYSGTKPSALVPTSTDQVVLDWIIEAFKTLNNPTIHFIGGYGADQIKAEFPSVDFIFNTDWDRTGSGTSLLKAPLVPKTTNYSCYADTVISPTAVNLLTSVSEEVVIAVDTTWQKRYANRTQTDRKMAEKVRLLNDNVVAIGRDIPITDAHAEFTGLVKFGPKATEKIAKIRGELPLDAPNLDVPAILTAIINSKIKIRAIDIGGSWAELNDRMDLAKFILRSKAEALETLAPLVKLSVIDPLVKFTFTQWKLNPEHIIEKVFAEFPASLLAVRSSANSEDSWSTSEAGKYHSALNVPPGNRKALLEAIGNVFDSYQTQGPRDNVIVQEMVTDLSVHGVATSRTMQNGAPYYTINYDDSSDDTTTVTSGNSGNLKLAVAYRHAQENLSNLPPHIRNLVPAIKEIERLVSHDALDIEFAITKRDCIHILQVRPLTMIATHETEDWDGKIDKEIESIKTKINALNKPAPSLFGKRTILGTMPDWNPAEIIGTRPRQLSVSLYRFLVTDNIWSCQRKEYGYRDVTPYPLLYQLGGHPYIDTRAMFNSFIPAAVPDDLADKLVNLYLNRLEQEPHLHDRVEFEIAITCLTFDFQSQVKPLEDIGISPHEIKLFRDALYNITDSATKRRSKDRALLSILNERYSNIMQSSAAPVDRAFILLEDCKQFGTLPFAHMARTAFIAVALLKSLESKGITTIEQTTAFLEQVPTVATQLETDAALVRTGELTWEIFVEQYGHLRPGTYDVANLRYADDPERYLRPLISLTQQSNNNKLRSDFWDEKTRKHISEEIKHLNFNWTVSQFETFLRESIQDREYAKFLFSKNISAALEEFVNFGKDLGISRDQLSHIDLSDISNLRNCEISQKKDWLTKKIAEGERSHEVALRVELPELIVKKSEIEAFIPFDEEPNFVTTKRVQAELVTLSATTSPSKIKDRIVLIPHADPGYDWLLAMPIAGLITMYGGANSHMSIRAAELSIPAAIGTGEQIYKTLSSAIELALDCESRRIEVIR